MPSAMTLGSDFREAELAPDVERQASARCRQEEATMNSSNEVRKASMKAEATAGRPSGSTTRRNVVHSCAPRSIAASAKLLGMAAKRPRMITTVVGSATMWPSTIAVRDGPRPRG